MKNKSLSKVAAGTLAIAGFVFGVSSAAQAVTTDTSFSTVVNRLQQSHYWEYQIKTRAGVSAVQFDYIGGTYTMNVKAQNGASGLEYVERVGIAESTTPSTIANSTPVGTATRLIVTNNYWIIFDVLTTGFFRTN